MQNNQETIREKLPPEESFLQDLEHLRELIKAITRDKQNLAIQLIGANERIDTIKRIILQGDQVRYCSACGEFYASGTKCDCTPGIDFD